MFLQQLFPRGKYNLMIFDFRAHGENKDNQFCTLGRDEALDVIAAGNFLKHHPDIKDKPLLVYGFSMGAVASIEAQAKDPSLFQAMILDCPFDTTANIIKRGIDKLKVSLFGYQFSIPGRDVLQRYAFHPYIQSLLKMMLKAVAHMDSKDIATRVFPISPSESIAQVKVPTMLIYCKNDEKVTVDAMKTIFDNCGALWKMIWISTGRRHFDTVFYRTRDYEEMVQNFMRKFENGELNKPHKEIIEEGDDQLVTGG
jgi:pimeloyl-ACP methyl ester carboxylesterase